MKTRLVLAGLTSIIALMALVALVALVAQPLAAQVRSEPQPIALPPAIEAPRDIAYPGVLTTDVDATDLEHRIFRVHQTVPVAPGPVVLLYPRWLPGNHGPGGALHNFAGLKISGGGKKLAWTRDTADVFAFHVDVPAGVTKLDIDAQFLSATEEAQGPVAMTREILRLNWYVATLYPAGYFMRRINVDASVKLPPSWDFGTALDVASRTDNLVKLKRVSVETLMDSPLIAGKHFKKFDLDPKGRSRVTLDVAADEPQYLEAKPEVIEVHRALVREIDKLYGARHFDHYDFLLTLSDSLAGSGLEHQRSSDNGTKPKYFTTWDKSWISRDLLAHEFNHSWDGKYRRPADLWTPNLNVPMRDSLLWVYEGQTQYYGSVLAARAGFYTKEIALDALAEAAAAYDARVGRSWRALQDTTNDPIISARRPVPWISWQRSEDYYVEGSLVWLEIDTLIRERSKGQRSLDDFARAFYGMNDGDWGQLTYTFEDVVSALNAVEPYDWAALLRKRLDENAAGAPLDGLKRGGYKLVYTETQGELSKDAEARRKQVDLPYSLGVSLEAKGKFTMVRWDGPIFKAGLTVGSELVAVNGVALDADKLKAVVKASKTTNAPIALLIKQGDRYHTVNLDYHGGARYPHLERITGAPALLDDIMAPKK